MTIWVVCLDGEIDSAFARESDADQRAYELSRESDDNLASVKECDYFAGPMTQPTDKARQSYVPGIQPPKPVNK